MSLPINSLYSLTWGDYGTSLVSAVQLLRCHGDLVDCTIAAGGRSFQAHKIVLCAASPFLLELLKNTPCKHPVVMLAGVNASDLEALLEFVYRGEVSVDHSQLPSLLQAAHCLNIQGLAPQTLSKDEFATSFQLHPTLIPHHHVKAVIDVGNGTMDDELITTIEGGQQTQQVHAHVVEEIMPDQLADVTDVKDVINQFLPTRKRKPRTKRPPGTSPPKKQKLIKTEAADQQNQQANGEDVKTVTSKDGTPVKVKSRSQSEQPASCPICGAVIRQSRNLRRHLELRHFSKPGIKKERKSNSSNNTSSTQNGNGSVKTVQVKKEPEDTNTPSTSAQTISISMAPSHTQHTLVDAGGSHVVTQHENTDGTTSLSISQMQTIPGHQLTLGNLNQATIQIRGDDQLESGLITTHEPTLRPHTELFRVGAVYTLEERRIDNNKLT